MVFRFDLVVQNLNASYINVHHFSHIFNHKLHGCHFSVLLCECVIDSKPLYLLMSYHLETGSNQVDWPRLLFYCRRRSYLLQEPEQSCMKSWNCICIRRNTIIGDKVKSVMIDSLFLTVNLQFPGSMACYLWTSVSQALAIALSVTFCQFVALSRR